MNSSGTELFWKNINLSLYFLTFPVNVLVVSMMGVGEFIAEDPGTKPVGLAAMA